MILDALIQRLSGRLYDRWIGDEKNGDAPGIDREAVSNVPGNFLRQWIASALTKAGDSVLNAKTVLAWLLTSLGAPVAMVAWLVPIRESGSMLPQLFLAGYIKRRAHRKGIWLLGAMLQALAGVWMGFAALTMEGVAAGWAVLIGLVGFSLARSLCSITSKDVMGKTIPKKRRGRLNGLAAGTAGAATIFLGAIALAGLRDAKNAAWFAVPLFGAGLLWVVAMVFYAGIREPKGEVAKEANGLGSVWKSLSLLRSDRSFCLFVITRALVLCSALSAPYYVVLSRQHGQAPTGVLGAFVLAGGLAAALSSVVWGRLADWSSRRVWQMASGMAVILGILVYFMEHHQWAIREWAWIYPVAFFLLSMAHSGVRVGRKTYLVDLAGGNKRTDYVSVSNTVIGIVLLMTGSLGALSNVWPPEFIILVLSLAGAVGVGLAQFLPHAEKG